MRQTLKQLGSRGNGRSQLVLAIVFAAACGDGSPSLAATCEDLEDTWIIEDHCVQGFVTEEIPIIQSNCEIETRGAFTGFSGTLTEAGTLTLGGALGVMEVDCTGTYTSSEMNLNCTDNCAVRLVAQ